MWNGGKAKIALAILQNSKQNGGVNLVNLVRKDKALKATWPQILHKEEDYAVLIYHNMRCPKIAENIWRCNILPEDVISMKFHNQFWKDVLESWSQYNFFYNRRIDNMIIWYNSQIRVKGKPIFWLNHFNKGLYYVHQLFEDCKYKTEYQVYVEFGLSVLRYNSLKSAIPKEWKDFFTTNDKQTFFPLAPHNYDVAIRSSQGMSSKVYQYLSDGIELIHN